MRIGAENQLKGKIVSVRPGAVNGTVGIELASGDVVTGSISMESINELGIKIGSPAYACIKATDVMFGIDE